MLSFKSYLAEASLSKTQLDKRDNYEVFATKIRDGLPFVTNTGEEVIIGYRDRERNKQLYDEITKKEYQAIVDLFKKGSTIVLPTLDGKGVRLSSLKKTKEFGSTGRTGTEDEDIQVRRLNGMIQKIMEETNMPYVSIKIAGEKHKIVRFEKTSGTPKSDIHGIDVKGNQVIWLSLKKGSSPKHFGQYGGMTPKGERIIAETREAEEFVDAVKEWLKNNQNDDSVMPRATTLSRKISDEKIKGVSVYGSKYGDRSYGKDNVQMILQGKLSLVESGEDYVITSSSHNETNPRIPKGQYEPVFMAMYKGVNERKNYGIRGARFSVYPVGGRKITEFI